MYTITKVFLEALFWWLNKPKIIENFMLSSDTFTNPVLLKREKIFSFTIFF